MPALKSEPLNSGPKDILAAYKAGRERVRQQLAVVQARRLQTLVGAALCIFLLVPTGCIAWFSGGPQWLAAAASLAVAGLFLARLFRGFGKEWRRLANREEQLEMGIARLTHCWQSDAATGIEFDRPGRPYSRDLQVLGEGSLFGLLCTTRSGAWAEKLAAYLLDPVKNGERLRRQQSVQELQGACALREQMGLLGSHGLQDCANGDLSAWLRLPPLRVFRWASLLLFAAGAGAAVLGIGIWAQALAWQPWSAIVIVLLLLQAAFTWRLRLRVRPHGDELKLLTNSFPVLWQGLALIEGLECETPKLREIVTRLRAEKASAHVRKLERLVKAFGQGEKPEFYLAFRLFAAGTQLTLEVERWRQAHGKALRVWLESWAEFEALMAIATCAFEHPMHAYPELPESGPAMEARQLGHPLLPADACVANDVHLSRSKPFSLVTGSNMAGKSTLLRAIGLNVVLAQAGAPVRAGAASISNLRVCAAFSPVDSLQEGKSRFLVEIEKLRSACRAADESETLFLIDEILSGTNSRDRRLVAELVVGALLGRGAIGAVSTHDLSLSSIVEQPKTRGTLVHMESANPDDPLAFDYLLKPGVFQHSSALAIARMLGLP